MLSLPPGASPTKTGLPMVVIPHAASTSSALADLLTGDQPLPHPVIEGLARLLGRWEWEQPPIWVTFVPSRTRPTLLGDLADHAGRLLGLPVHAVIQRMVLGRLEFLKAVWPASAALAASWANCTRSGLEPGS